MQLLTHFLSSILITRWVFSYLSLDSKIAEIIILSIFLLLSHFILDFFSRFTYHPVKAHLKDTFFVVFHGINYLLSAVVLVLFLKEYWYALLIGMFPDIIGSISVYIFKKQYVLHGFIDRTRDKAKWIPNWTENKWASIFEIILVILLILII